MDDRKPVVDRRLLIPILVVLGLVAAAGGSVTAHLLDLERRGLVEGHEGETWIARSP